MGFGVYWLLLSIKEAAHWGLNRVHVCDCQSWTHCLVGEHEYQTTEEVIIELRVRQIKKGSHLSPHLDWVEQWTNNSELTNEAWWEVVEFHVAANLTASGVR